MKDWFAVLMSCCNLVGVAPWVLGANGTLGVLGVKDTRDVLIILGFAQPIKISYSSFVRTL